jgi:DNA-binding response OmpR family regulator
MERLRLFKELIDFKPSVVLLDWHLDEPRNGISIIGEIRDGEEQISTIPIVVVFSRRMSDDKQNALNVGASDYIVKPISVAALAAAASKLIPQFERHCCK